MVRILPLAQGEVRSVWSLIERVGWELHEQELASLADIGMFRRRVWIEREATGPWLVDVIEGNGELERLGAEAVWATGATGLDHWIGTHLERICIGDLSQVPGSPPALDLTVPSGRIGEPLAQAWRLETPDRG